MNNISDYKFDAMLSVAVRNLGLNELEEFDKLDDSGVHFSPAFEKKMLKALGKGKRTVLRAKKVIKTILVACLTLLSAVAMLGMAIPPVREAFVNTVVEWYERYVEIKLFAENKSVMPRIIETKKEPSEVINEYHKEVVIDSLFTYEVEYTDAFSCVRYRQCILEDYRMLLDNTNCNITKINIGEYSADLFMYDDVAMPIVIIWSDANYAYKLSGNIALDEMIVIAESIE